MTLPAAPASFGDREALAALKHVDGRQAPDALREAARQFESLFTRMLLKSMREASFGDPLFGDNTFERDMYDDQLAIELSRGQGLGLADVLVQQLTRAGVVAAPEGAAGSRQPNGVAAAARTQPAEATAFRPANREAFVRELWPDAERAGAELGVDPRTLLAHAALETGWGRHFPADASGRSSLNLFGIKATGGWSGDSVGSRTLEFTGGVAERRTERFRAYGSAGESFRDYVELIRDNPRYRAALGTGSDAAAFGRALQEGGYATDPAYAAKLERVAGELREFDPPAALKTAAHAPITRYDELES